MTLSSGRSALSPEQPFELELHPLPKPQQVSAALIESVFGELGVEDASSMGWAAQELVGNALRHATAPVTLQLSSTPGWVKTAVLDGFPVPFDITRYTARRPLTLEEIDALALEAPELEHRRGLTTISRICGGRLGTSLYPGYKAIWFLTPIPRGTRMSHTQVANHLSALPSDCYVSGSPLPAERFTVSAIVETPSPTAPRRTFEECSPSRLCQAPQGNLKELATVIRRLLLIRPEIAFTQPTLMPTTTPARVEA